MTSWPLAGELVGEAGHARAEHLLELREPLVDRAGEFAGAAVDALVEGVDVIAHRFGHVLGALAEAFDQFAAVGLHGAVELGHVAGDEAAERGGVARDLLAELGAALVEHVLEGLQARCQHLLDGVAAGVERLVPALRRCRGRCRRRRCCGSTTVSVTRAPVCSSLETTSPPRRLRSSTSESPVERSVVFTSSARAAMVSAIWLPVSVRASLNCCERLAMVSMVTADFCAKPCATWSSRAVIICCRRAASSANSSCTCSVLKLRLAVSRSLAGRNRGGGACRWWFPGGRAWSSRARSACRSCSRRRGRAPA